MQFLIHYFLHLIFPAIVAYMFFRPHWCKVYLIFLATMLVDIDHLLASPIFDPCRCSVGFHPLHSYWAIAFYVSALLYKPARLIALGLLMHMATDAIDCYMSLANC